MDTNIFPLVNGDYKVIDTSQDILSSTCTLDRPFLMALLALGLLTNGFTVKWFTIDLALLQSDFTIEWLIVNWLY